MITTIRNQRVTIRPFAFILLCLLLVPPVQAEAPPHRGEHTWHAHLHDENGAPVPYANIILNELNTGAVSDEQGHVEIHHLPAGVFTADISVIGYVNRSVQIRLPQQIGERVEIELQHTVLEGSTVTVTVTGLPTDVLNSERTVTVLEGEALARQQGQSVSATLAKVPGVQILSQGHAVAKPVIRGMTNQRLVLLKDGIRQEGQQWGGHHTPEADVLSIGRIEVLRGPIGLIYGSEALGGVIQLQSPQIRTLDEGGEPWRLGIRSGFRANSRQALGALGLQRTWQHSGLRLNVSGRQSGDYAVPGDDKFLQVQDGTAYRQMNIDLHASHKLSRNELELLASHYWEEQTLIGEGHWHNTGGGADGDQPWFHVLGSILSPTLHQTLTLKGKWLLDNSWLEYDLGTQLNHRQGGPEGEEPVVDLEAGTQSLNLRWRHLVQERLPGTIGLSVQSRNSDSRGSEVLLPDYQQLSMGGYAYYRWMLADLTFSGGLRLDGVRYDIEETRFTQNYQIESTQKTFVPVTSGSLGLVWHRPEAPYSIALNMGSGWRPPNPYELYINGVHHGDWKIEIGDPDLDPEIALNTDLILRHVAQSHTGEVSFFYNHMRDFIHSSPTGSLDALTGIPIYQIEQGNARTYGFEFRLQHVLGEHWRWELGADAMHGEVLYDLSDADGDGEVETALPAINPPRALLGLMFFHPGLGLFRDIEFGIDAELVNAQKRLAEFENMLDNGYGVAVFVKPKSYQRFNTRLKTDLLLGQQTYTCVMGIDNFLNEKYYDHLSRYKGIAYNPGFDFYVSISVNL